MERHLSAVLVADVVGYSRLMGADEAGTLAELDRHNAALFNPKAVEHNGRIVKLMGDGKLMEFASVVDAVSFAVDVQAAMARANEGLPEERRIDYRIGINLGDIMHQDGDIFGDGVNVAARIEALAEPGGICLSRSTCDQVRDKLDLTLSDLGDVRVKNIARPVRVFKVVMDGKALALATPVAIAGQTARPVRNPLYAAGLAAVLVLAGGFYWWQPWAPKIEIAATENVVLPLPDKPSIAVLPFSNVSDDASQEYFADGMTDDLITSLSKVSGLFVIARNSSFTFKDKPTLIPEVAEKLGVRYVLEGSVRRSGKTVRVNALLIDATTGGHVWAERYDGDVTDYFTVQDTFVEEIVDALSLKLSKSEREEISKGQSTNLLAREAFQKGWQEYQRYTAGSNAEAARQFLTATELDPDYGRAYSALSMAYVRGCQWRWNAELGKTTDEAFNEATKYLAIAERNSSAITKVAAAQLRLYNNQHDRSFVEAARAIALDPNDPEAQLAMGVAMITTGRAKAGLEFVETAVRLSPSHPTHFALAEALGHFALNDMKQAVAVLKSTLKRNPDAIDLAPLLAASQANAGDLEAARATLKRWKPGADNNEIGQLTRSYHFPYKLARTETRVSERLRGGLAMASLPAGVNVGSLMRKLQQGDIESRINAARTLALFGELAVEAVPALIETVQSEHTILSKNAIDTLGRIGPRAKAALPVLEEMNRKKISVFAVRRAIREIRGEPG
ncbi:HEAT repeat domain-containing protein [Roseibium sp.]|uniref:HEAT repeat domain-containing protein n=1 Tax=Roseibium sp. TaxID=1936156 RepID=UPI003D149B27